MDDTIDNTDASIIIFPNPFSVETEIQFHSAIKNADINLYNMYGQKIKTIYSITGSGMKIKRGNLPSGIYFISIEENKKTVVSRKLVVVD